MDRATVIEKAFSRVSETYSHHAFVQKQAALDLYQKFTPLPQGKWLEIGAGSGFLTEQLLKESPQHLTVNDLSPSMLERLPSSLQKIAGDAETIQFAEKYSLIASSFAVQWFKNPKTGLLRLGEKLEKGGKMIICLPLSSSFQEWKELVNRHQVPFTLNHFPGPDELRDFPGFISRLEIEEYPMEFEHPLAFLSWFKKIGAGTSFEKKRLPYSFLKSLANNKISFKTRMTVGFLEIIHSL